MSISIFLAQAEHFMVLKQTKIQTEIFWQFALKISNGSKLDHNGFWSFAQKQICKPIIFLSSIGGPRQDGSVEILRSSKGPSVQELQTKKTLMDPMDHTHQSYPPYPNTNSLAATVAVLEVAQRPRSH